jgi:hypothetical protein
MRYRLMATYQGAPYEAGIGPSDGDVVLFAACPPPEELGFEPATGHWRKQLRVQDVQALWESRPMATYRGQRCMVLDDLGDRLHIAYLGHDSFQAQQLGYWQVDRGVFELVTPRDEVTDVTEERADYPGQPASSEAEPPAAAGNGSAEAGHRPAAAGYRPAAAGYSPAAADHGPATADYGPLSADYGPATTDFGVIFPAAGLTPAPVFGGTALPGRSPSAPPPDFGTTALPGRSAAARLPDYSGAPSPRAAPLPLEAAALRAASAASHPGHTWMPEPLATQPPPAAQAPPAAQTPLTAEVPAARQAPLTLQDILAQAPATTRTPLAAEPPPAAVLAPAVTDLLAAPAAPPGLEVPEVTAPPSAPVTAAPAMPARPTAPELPPRPTAPVSPAAPLAAASPRRRRSDRSRMATQRIFTELAALAAIPAAAYAVGEEVDGALCLIETAAGYEVFSAAGGARHEVRFFEDEESAYFYLFGVLAAEAVRTGLLIPHR